MCASLTSEMCRLLLEPRLYIHRIGRSGRFGRKGVAINFAGAPRELDSAFGQNCHRDHGQGSDKSQHELRVEM